MKHLFYILIILSLFCSCRSYVEIIKLRAYTAKDSITVNLKLYEVNQRLNPILDSLIIAVEECPKFQNTVNDFSYIAYPVENKILIYIGNIPGRHANYGRRDGLFYYKGYSFYCDGILPESFFSFKNEYVEIRCVDPEKYILDMVPDRGGNSYWWYDYENGELKCTGFVNCGRAQ